MARTNSTTSMDDIRNIFNKFDKNGDGKISLDEIKGSLRNLGMKVSSEEVCQLMQEYDKDGDGFIDLHEFVELYNHGGLAGGATSDEKDLRAAFDMYDIDKDGLISATELHEMMNKIGEKCSTQDCEKMISYADEDGDGHVNFDEFKKFIHRN